MRRLRDAYRDDHRTRALIEGARGGRSMVVGAVHGGFAPMLVAAALSELGDDAPPLVVCGDPATTRDDLEELGCTAVLLPEMDELDEPEDGGLSESNRHLLARRVAALEAARGGAVLVASHRAVDQAVPDLAQLTRRSIVLRPGETHDLHRVSEQLVDQGYQVAAAVEHPGQLAVRGGLLDVFPLAAEHPLRIEFFDDEVDVIRRFDAFTQESIARVKEAVLSTGSAVIAEASLWSQLPPGPIIAFGDLALGPRLRKPHGRVELRLARQLEQGAEDGATVAVDRFKGDQRRDFDALQAAAAEGARLIVAARNGEARDELLAHLGDHAIEAEVVVGRLAAGYRDLERDLLLVHDFELAHRRATRRRANKVLGGAPLDSLTDLKPGDYVVHVNNGIAKFRGMATLERRGYLEDFLLLAFADEARLYVPVTAIDLVQKYIGGSGRHPELSKLGGAAWRKRKAKAEQAVEDLTAELLTTQVAREAATGIRFDPDDAQLRRFEADFPYEETEDQLTAAREIKRDMESPKVMDRLLCGDVGFGKTEIAMRAAYKAVASGYQVAVLAPTTLLTEQHLSSFRDRMDGFPVRIECINRFRSGPERAAIERAAKAGEIDILIGTHAILSEGIGFERLGLVIIDEEHRFGVKQKEALKQVAPGCDVLTLSATPIPRTLHFSLLGLRDISVLAEAPSQRLAIETRVAPWDDHLIKTAIEREIEREGQVFFVHNRVKDIDQVAFKLSRLVPEMRMEVVHGQMDESRIGTKMHRFRAGGVDCLVATSIVESGIDIPNANTLFVNNAHAFGLAELHQIRGRIGRFTRQAYAYFMTPPGRQQSLEATQRLDAIQEYAELGAGFKLAMRDLELRGAGNLLGPEQSGQIDAVGYELYCRLLADAVRRSGLAVEGAEASEVVRGTQRKDSVLAFAVEAYVPDDYLDSPALKFELHKLLDGCRGTLELRELARTTRDRYGPLPPQVARLFQLRAIRFAAAAHGITRIEVKERQLHLTLTEGLPESLQRVQLPELIHVQGDGEALVLFTKLTFDQDSALEFMGRLFELELEFLDPLRAARSG